jgi:hypothetical protein
MWKSNETVWTTNKSSAFVLDAPQEISAALGGPRLCCKTGAWEISDNNTIGHD